MGPPGGGSRRLPPALSCKVLEGGGVADGVISFSAGRARGVTVLTVEGEIDAAAAPLLRAALEPLTHTRVILDLSAST